MKRNKFFVTKLFLSILFLGCFSFASGMAKELRQAIKKIEAGSSSSIQETVGNDTMERTWGLSSDSDFHDDLFDEFAQDCPCMTGLFGGIISGLSTGFFLGLCAKLSGLF